MFLSHFLLSQDPFGVTADPAFLYFSREHREALSSLYFGLLESRGFSMMVASPGMGKTSLLHYLQERMKEEADFVWLNCSCDDRELLLDGVMSALGVERGGASYFENRQRFQQFLLEQREAQRKVVLLCDEAQSLSRATLENIRLLSNLETTEANLLQVVLAGQPDLVEFLKSADMEQLGQRINLCCRIRPLDAAETEAYIHHRLRVAGRRKRLFTTGALTAIARASHGIPRNINTVCYNAMTRAWTLGRRQVEEEHVLDVLADLPLAGFSYGAPPRLLTTSEAPDNALPEPEYEERRHESRRSLVSRNGQRDLVRRPADSLAQILEKLDSLTRAFELLNERAANSQVGGRLGRGAGVEV
jgi:type II secretory pathway predicted ATPase ExeA